MMLTISRRLGLLVALAVLASLAIIVVQLVALRSSLQKERQNAVMSEVQTAASIVRNFAAAAERGQMSVAEAQERAKAVLRDIRYGNNDFFFVYLPDGNTIVLGTRPDLENKIRIETKDANGVYYVRDLIAAAQRSRQQMDAVIRDQCASEVPGDTYRNLQVDARYHDQTFKHVLVPVWLLSYTFGSSTYQVVVNGVTGSIAGSRPWSWIKIGLLVLVVVVIALIILASQNN